MKCMGITKQYIKMQNGKLIMYDVCVRRDTYTVGNERDFNHNEFYGNHPPKLVYEQYSRIRKEFIANLV